MNGHGYECIVAWARFLGHTDLIIGLLTPSPRSRLHLETATSNVASSILGELRSDRWSMLIDFAYRGASKYER